MMNKEERREYDKRYRAIHRDKIRFQHHAYYSEHIAEIKARERNRYRNKKEQKLKQQNDEKKND